MRDFEIVEGSAYRMRNGKITTLIVDKQNPMFCMCPTNGYYYQNSKKDGHLVFGLNTHNEFDLMERISY